MDAEKKPFFMMTIEIRILAAMLARFAFRSFEDHFSSHNADISGVQYGILRTLSSQHHTISELSRHFMVDPSTLVPMIDSLERKGLVTRGKDPNDRRRIPLAITEQGTHLIHSVPLFHDDDLLFKCLDSMGETKSRELLSLLREVIERMPEGEDMLQSVSSRIYTYAEGESPPHQPDCELRKNPFENEHTHLIHRSIRRRTRKNR